MSTKNNNEVTIFMPSLGGGGAETIVIHLMEGLIRSGIEVTLLLATPHGTLHDQIPSKVRVKHLNCKRSIHSVFKLKNYIQKYNPGIILSHLERANRVVLSASLMARRGTKVYVVEHNTMSIALKSYSYFQKSLLMLSYKYLYRHAEAIIHVSYAAAKDLSTLLPEDKKEVKTIYNPIVDKTKISEISHEPPHEWFKSKNIPVVLGVGRLTEQKDFLNLIQAFLIVRKQCDARLIILGDGEQRKLLEKMIIQNKAEESVCLMGFVRNPLQFMKHASLFVLSSMWEALPTVLVEALACGCPVVSTDCPSGPAEILDNGKYGRLVSPGDCQALANAIIDSLGENIEKSILRNRADAFSIKRATDEYIRILGLKSSVK